MMDAELHNNLGDLRRGLSQAMTDLRAGTVTVDEVLAIAAKQNKLRRLAVRQAKSELRITTGREVAQ